MALVLLVSAVSDTANSVSGARSRTEQSLFRSDLSPGLFLYFFYAMAVVVGVAAGFIPSLFFARIQAIQVLKDASSLKVFRHVSMRKALIVIQYTFSLIFHHRNFDRL
jgi:hypothetical protein